jgi:hypothetical protein
LVVAISTVLATLLWLSSPARAGLEVPFDFGTQEVGTTSDPRTATIPLTATVEQIRPALLAGIAASNPPSLPPYLTTEQIRDTLTAAVNAVPGTDVLGVRIDSVTLGTGTDFAVTGCVGADGATVASCDLSATFTPTDIGDRSDTVSMGFTTTQFPTADVEAALTTALEPILGPLASSVVPFVIDLLMPLVEDSVSSSLNPVALLSGVGAPAAEVSEVPVAWAAPVAVAAALGAGWLWRRRRSAVA